MRQAAPDGDFEILLDYLKRLRGFDFTGYKSTSVMRRVTKRMQTVGIGSFADYIDYLEVHPDEFAHLFNTILINVTGFFRDPQNWEYLAETVIPRILAGKRNDEPIRVWSAGCASGEEAYSIAMLLAEALGPEAFRERVKIYATDVDEEALTFARQAMYTPKQVETVPPELLDKHFEIIARHYIFSKELRRSVIFGRHDLIQDAPISRADLLICRNTLMYFNSETQGRILARFHFALNDGGFLFLGKAEMLFTHTNTFQPVDLRRRIFTKIPKGNLRERLLLMAQAGSEEAAGRLANHVRVREAAFDAAAGAQIVIDAQGYLLLANEQARALFGITTRDLGRPLQDLEVSYRPVELRSLIEQAYAERRPVSLREVEWPRAADNIAFVDVQVTALTDNNSHLVGALVAFADVTRFHKLQAELQDSNQELEAAYEELQSTSEELETTNEELQSTVEELETTNEELQSTNEELETVNEELQSANEELQTINDELRQRGDELNEANAFMSAILASLRGAVVVLDPDLHVKAWNHRAEDLWGLRADETIGSHFLGLDIGLPVNRLKQPIRACLAGDSKDGELVLDATNRRGKAVRCRVTVMPLVGLDHATAGAILLMDENGKA